MQDPLKQGLKLRIVLTAPAVRAIPMQDPLKQGLKHAFAHVSGRISHNSNARSTKTRIETLLLCF